MASRRERFRILHAGPGFIIPNPWDAGSARILEFLGYEALATTSSGHAASLGRLDGQVTREEAIEHARVIVAATPLPVNADLENGFGDSPQQVADTVRSADAVGLAGCSIEDWARQRGELYPRELAVERIVAASEAARPGGLVLTARAENHIRGNPDLTDTITRLQAYQQAGADVLYAPGLRDLAEIRSLVASIDRPLNVLLLPGGPSAPELLKAGARRVSVGSALSLVANVALLEAARELRDQGTLGSLTRASSSIGELRSALAPRR